MLSLDLPVKSLLVYALIHSYSQECGWFCYKYKIAQRLRMHPSGVSRALSGLWDKGLIAQDGFAIKTEYDDSGPFIVVYDWMFNYNLNGRELLVFALIYGFTRKGKVCYGQRGWMEKRLNISNVGKVITALKKRGLIREVYKPDKSSFLMVNCGADTQLAEMTDADLSK